jgi:hypothetical protein
MRSLQTPLHNLSFHQIGVSHDDRLVFQPAAVVLIEPVMALSSEGVSHLAQKTCETSLGYDAHALIRFRPSIPAATRNNYPMNGERQDRRDRASVQRL